MTNFTIHPQTKIGPVHLKVANLARSVNFYQSVLGFQPGEKNGNVTLLTAGDGLPLLRLTEDRQASPKPARSTGLYHFAILFPTRRDLAVAAQRLIDLQYPVQGAADHLVSEAIYLADPDGNGIEIYADRPREQWPRLGGELKMATEPLNLPGLLAELNGNTVQKATLPAGTTMGHIHLHVSDIETTESFYRDGLGFEVMTRYGPAATFMSAGGYHHHLGANTWAGVNAPPPPANSVGLQSFAIQLPDETAFEALKANLNRQSINFQDEGETISLKDPSQNHITLSWR